MKVYLLGYYGHGNAGDDWLREKTLQLLKDHTTTRSIFDCDWVVCGGGSLLQDQTSRRSLYYYLGILMLAKSLGKKISLIAQGFGPFRFRSSELLTAQVLKGLPITVRDQASQIQLEKMGIPSTLTADLAYYEATIQNSSGSAVALSVRKSKFCPGLFLFLKELDGDLVFKDFQPPKDRAFFESAYPGIQTQPDQPVRAMIAMRYHACVWASLNNIPFLAVAYDEKVKNIAEELNQPWVALDATQSEIEEKWNRVNEMPTEKVKALIERASLNEIR